MWRRATGITNAKPAGCLIAFEAITLVAVEAKAQTRQEASPALTTPLEPLRPGITEAQLFAT